jgi:acyl-coenzyme A thioesterase PaaI-like protein
VSDAKPPAVPRRWLAREPGQLIGRGHPAGDFLEAWKWRVLEEAPGLLRIAAHLPEQVRNPRGQLFGGFTPTYVDLVALLTVRAGADRSRGPRSWLATTSLRVEYFEPVTGDFTLESRLVKRRGRTLFVETRFFDAAGELAVFATATLREVDLDRPLGDA